MYNTCSYEEELYYKEVFGRLKDVYTYEGPVLVNDINVCNRWNAKTYAISGKKAKSNLMYQYKKEHGLPINTKIDLPGIILVG